MSASLKLIITFLALDNFCLTWGVPCFKVLLAEGLVGSVIALFCALELFFSAFAIRSTGQIERTTAIAMQTIFSKKFFGSVIGLNTSRFFSANYAIDRLQNCFHCEEPGKVQALFQRSL